MEIRNKTSSILIIILILVSLATVQTTTADTGPHAVKGVLYVNDEIAPEGTTIKIEFDQETITDETYTYNQYQDNTNYNIGFWDHEGETGDISVVYQQTEYIPDDNQTITIQEDVIGYIMELHITVTTPPPPINHPPNQPTVPDPENNSENIDLNPTLSVFVSDPDNDDLNVSFYNASDDSLIDTVENIPNGTRASTSWSDLSYNTTYNWYTVVNDSEYTKKSDNWCFTTKTKQETNNPPEIKITQPEEGALYLNNNKIFSGLLKIPLIIGDLTIKVNATDVDDGIEHVDFYIYDFLGQEITKGNDTTYPYCFNWTKDRTRLIHVFTIKTIAYDYHGEKAEETMQVRKIF